MIRLSDPILFFYSTGTRRPSSGDSGRAKKFSDFSVKNGPIVTYKVSMETG